MMAAILAVIMATTNTPMRWSEISVRVGDVPIVQGVSLEARSGRLLGVLGPSGAGKTTLLGVLSGRCTRTPTGAINAVVPAAEDVAFLEQHEHFFGLLTVHETLTLAAALERGGGGGKAARRCTADDVDELLQTLGLACVQHSRVGDATHRGISGGERRRLAVGCALLASPALLVADEPTTGLDAHQAQRTVQLLRDTAAARQLPAIATLHQPRSSIWATLDDVLLLAPRGRVVYHGRRDAALSHFARIGHPCPPHTNPAEHLIDLVSVDHHSMRARKRDEARIDALASAWAERAADEAAGGCYDDGTRAPSGPLGIILGCGGGGRRHAEEADGPAADGPAAAASSTAPTDPPAWKKFALRGRRRSRRMGPLRRLGLLLRRSWRQNIRDTWSNALRLGVSGGLALIFGEIFGRLSAPTAASVAERVALLSYAAINMAMMALMKTLDLLGREKPVVRHEAARGHYGAPEYVLAKVLAEVPLDATFAAGFGALLHWRIGLRLPPRVLVSSLALTAASCAGLGLAIGAVAGSAESALALGIPVMVVFMVLGIINPAGQACAKPPSAGVRLLANVSPIKWAVRSVVGAELRGMALERGSLRDAPRIGGLALATSGDEVLEQLGIMDDTPARCARRLAQLLAAECAVAASALWLTKPRYAPMAAALETAVPMDLPETD